MRIFFKKHISNEHLKKNRGNNNMFANCRIHDVYLDEEYLKVFTKHIKIYYLLDLDMSGI